ncbi:MAG: WG repeat-containing protein [Rikenellaceae bacterium]
MSCSVVQILRAMNNGTYLFRTLGGDVKLRNCDDGRLFYSVGNSAICFNFWHSDTWYSLKCYTSKSPYRRAIYGSKLLESELYIPQHSDRGEWIDVVTERWIEGEALSKTLPQALREGNSEQIKALSVEFDKLALKLLDQEWAHGDISYDNIIVDTKGALHLIDFDAAFTPQLAGKESIEIGTKAYQHSTRNTTHFDRSIDDYPLALISTTLSLLALDISTYTQYAADDGLLFDPLEIFENRSESYNFALTTLSMSGEIFAYNIAKMLSSRDIKLPQLQYIMRYKVEGVHPTAEPTTIFSHNDLWGYLNKYGREVIPPLFDQALDFNDSFAAVKLGSAWHYIDSRAQIALNCSEYSALKSCRNGVGRAQQTNGEWIRLSLSSFEQKCPNEEAKVDHNAQE